MFQFFLCCILFMLHFSVLNSFHVLQFPCWTFFVLHPFHFALFFIFHSFPVKLCSCCYFPCCTAFMLLFCVALFSCCTFLMLPICFNIWKVISIIRDSNALFSCCTVMRQLFFSEQVFCRKRRADCLLFNCCVI